MIFMIFNHPNHLRKTSTHPIFSLLEVLVPLLATQRPQTATRPLYNAMSNCKPKCDFFFTFRFFLWSMGIGLHFNNGNMIRNVNALLVRNVNTPPTPPSPLINIRQHVQHVNNGNMFRNVNALLVRNVTTPHHPPTPPPWWPYDSMCNMLTTPKSKSCTPIGNLDF